MPILNEDADVRRVLERARTIAVVGLSNNPERDSYQIAFYLRKLGYSIIPVNPTVTSVFGITAFPDLDKVTQPVDIVNVFRRPEFLPAIVASALAIKAPVLWTQLGVIHDEALRQASNAGMEVVADRCIMVEHRRLGISPLKH